MGAKHATIRTVNRIAYFGSRFASERALVDILDDWPHARILEYDLGYAIQIHKGGDYIGPDLKPSLAERGE